MVNINLVNIVKWIIAEQGEAVLADPKRLKAFFADLARDEPKPLRLAFVCCIEARALNALKAARNAAERAENKETLARRMRDEQGLDKTLCAEALDILEAALFAAAPKKQVCAECGKDLQDGWKVCPFCGAAAKKQVCAECGKDLRDDWNVCPFCGAGTGATVYVAGSERDGSISKAVYWKNGQKVVLSNEISWADSIFVAGSDVYVAGCEQDGNSAKVMHWKNGKQVVLSNSGFSRYSIFVTGSDVYVAGFDDGKAVYWKNGQKVVLSNGYSWVISIFVTGSDVYVAGQKVYYVVEQKEDGHEVKKTMFKAVYWKNGQKVVLSNEISYAHSIFVAGSDVYVAGNKSHKAVYWKNGQKVVLSNEYSSASSIFVTGAV